MNTETPSVAIIDDERRYHDPNSSRSGITKSILEQGWKLQVFSDGHDPSTDRPTHAISNFLKALGSNDDDLMKFVAIFDFGPLLQMERLQQAIKPRERIKNEDPHFDTMLIKSFSQEIQKFNQLLFRDKIKIILITLHPSNIVTEKTITNAPTLIKDRQLIYPFVDALKCSSRPETLIDEIEIQWQNVK